LFVFLFFFFPSSSFSSPWSIVSILSILSKEEENSGR